MWNLIVLLPDHCLSFFISLFLLHSERPKTLWSFDHSECHRVNSIKILHKKEGGPEYVVSANKDCLLTLKAPITTAADDIHKYFFIVFRENKT